MRVAAVRSGERYSRSLLRLVGVLILTFGFAVSSLAAPASEPSKQSESAQSTNPPAKSHGDPQRLVQADSSPKASQDSTGQAGSQQFAQADKTPQPSKDSPATPTFSTSSTSGIPPPTTTFSVNSFHTDLFTAAATSEIPIMVPPGAAGTAPKIVLRYNSSVVDDLEPREQGEWTGLGWSLDVGGFIVRDTKGTTSTTDDTFKLIFAGVTHDLVAVGGGRYRAKDETFWLINYVSPGDYWTLKAKDGTTQRFGFNADSKATGLTFGVGTEVPVTFEYLLDEVTTTSGTAVRYSYFKQSSTYRAQAYDQAVYPDTITYAYHSGSIVGSPREVRFIRGSRTDWTDTSASTHTSYHDLYRLDAIEVRVGESLVRKYVFGFDYSIDRDPAYTWGGGATGDLTLRSITMFGTDGTSALPATTFTYSAAVLASASNGIGGSVSFTYEKIIPLYRYCFRERPDQSSQCDDWGPNNSNPPAFDPPSTLLGAIVAGGSGTIPIYRQCLLENSDSSRCLDWGPSTNPIDPNPSNPQVLLGNVLTTASTRTNPIYRTCLREDSEGRCLDWGPSTNPVDPNPGNPQVLLGYIYAGKLDRPRHRVTSRTLSNGLGWSSSITFTYWNPDTSADLKEFRGHAQVRSTDPLGNYTDTWFHQDDAKKGRAYQVEVRSNAAALFSRIDNAWSVTNPAPGVTFAALSRVDNYECDGQASCIQTAQTFTYDSNGNPTQTAFLGHVSVTGDERTETTDWSVDSTNWIHRPSRTALLDSAGAVVRERWLSYDTLGRLTGEESRLVGPQGSAGNPVVAHAYDAYGNKTSTTDPRGCATSITFDVSQTYPATVTNCLGHAATSQYDDRFGMVTSQTDPNGQTTTSTYDVFGRLTKTTGPLDGTSTYGTVSLFHLDWGTPSAQRVQTFRTEQHGTGNVLWSEEFFDGLGRVDTVRREGPGGQTILTETTFDARGLVAATSAPHFSTEAPVWTQFSYDVLGRQTQVTNPDGTTVGTSYLNDVITITDERGNVKRKYLDAYDRLIRVDEVNGAETYVTTYQYDTAGSLTRVTNHLGHVTQITYDLLGRKVTMQDPNMGTWSYAYDLGGNLTSQTDAKNQTLTFSYDLQGRLTTKGYPDTRQVTWTYDDPAVAFSKGRLTRVVDLAGTTNFTYDQLGRVTQTQRTIDGLTHTMTQQYDALGRIISETFPDNETVSYTYNEAGWLNTIPGYVNGITYNARGQKTELQYANGVSTTWTHNAQTFRITNRSSSGPGGNLQNLSYSYDDTGNVTGINDTLFTANRTFTYDALNRLTQATGNFGPDQSLATHNYSYDAIGNILTKADVVYSYTDPLHPAAVTSTSDGKSYTYDENGNMLTGANRTFIWDADNRLTSVSTGAATASMVYDYTGIRVRKESGGAITYYPFSGYEIDPAGIITKYIRIGIETVAAKKSTGESLFYHNDHLGGINVISDITGLRAQLIEYDPWGKVSRAEGNVDPTHRFTGKMLDPESGLYYYGGRYYDPELARFISPDPFVPYPDDPQSLNRYSYVINNPVNYIDPDGYFHDPIKKKKKKGGFFRSFFGFFVGAIITAVTGGAGAPAWAAAAIGGAVGGAVHAGLNQGNPFLGGLIGAFTAGITGGLLGGEGGFLTPALVSSHAGVGASSVARLIDSRRDGQDFDGFPKGALGRECSAGDDFCSPGQSPIVLAGAPIFVRIPPHVRTRPSLPRNAPREPERLDMRPRHPQPKPANPLDRNQPTEQMRDKFPDAVEGPHDPFHCSIMGPGFPGCGHGGVVPPLRVPGGGQNPKPYPIPELIPDPRA